MELPVESHVAGEIEEFICLGFINWKLKGDKTQAIRDFEAFLSSGKKVEFATEREIARKWISEIQHTEDGS